jgi:hypothetical protein
MAITTNNPANVLVLITDTTLLNPTTGRASITFANLHEQTGAQETVELFVSTDSSSAAGERIDKIVLAANETVSPISLAGLSIPSGSFLIAKGTAGSLVKADLSYTQYTGSS